MPTSLVILGSGYTAAFLLPLAERRYDCVYATSRLPDQHLDHVSPDRRIRFDLTQRDTWMNIPAETDLLWCFPAAPLDLVQECAATFDLSSRRIVVLGSTSAYEAGTVQAYPPPWVDETSPIDLSKPRVQGEEFLRTRSHATVLRVAGIYGPGRNPLDWIRTGRVGSSRKYVNMVHVEDLAAICLLALEEGKSGENYNVSDGVPRTWREICHYAQERWALHAVEKVDDTSAGKRIANGKLLSMLGTARGILHHSDLFQSLARLHDGPPMP